jgi:excisionase family DNA binding protein
MTLRSPHDSADPFPRIFTKSEAAEILRVRESWLEKKAAARRIPFTKLGGSYHFTAEHLQRIAAEFEEMPVFAIQRSLTTQPVPRRKRREPPQTADPRVVPLRARPPRTPRQKNVAA